MLSTFHSTHSCESSLSGSRRFSGEGSKQYFQDAYLQYVTTGFLVPLCAVAFAVF
jgi:hypothetical protein